MPQISSAQNRAKWSTELAQRSLRCAQITDKLMQIRPSAETSNSKHNAGPSVLQKLLQGLSKNRKDTLPTDFLDVRLWQAVRDFSHDACTAADGAQAGTVRPSASKSDTAQSATGGTGGVKSAEADEDFRTFYVQRIAEAFSDELDALRKAEQMDEHGVRMLAECLENGTNIFTDVEKQLYMVHQKKAGRS